MALADVAAAAGRVLIPGGTRDRTQAANILAQTAKVPSIPWSGSYGNPGDDGPLQANLQEDGTIPQETFEAACVTSPEEALAAAEKVGYHLSNANEDPGWIFFFSAQAMPWKPVGFPRGACSCCPPCLLTTTLRSKHERNMMRMKQNELKRYPVSL